MTPEEKKTELLTMLHAARMDKDFKRVRKLCKEYLVEFQDEPERRKIASYLVEADIELKFYSEAESVADSLIPRAGKDELSLLNIFKADIDEARGDYYRASRDLLTAIRVNPVDKVKENVVGRLRRLAPLLGDNERRRLINEFSGVEVVSILINESLRYASETGDTASVRILSELLPKYAGKERTTSPFGAKKIVVPQRLEERSAEVFKVGLICPLSGRLSPIGREFLRGASIALREAMLSRRINMELIVMDTKGDPLVAMKETKRLIKKEGVRMIVGAVLSSTTIAAAIVAQEHGIPFLSPAATAEGIDEIGDKVFQLDDGSEAEVTALAEVAAKNLKLRRVAVLAVADEKTYRITRLFCAELERLGGEIAAVEFYEEGTTDFKKYFESIRSSNPDGLFIPSETEDLILILPQLSFYEFGVRLLGLSNWNSERLLRMVSKDMEGAVFPSAFLNDYQEQSLRTAASLLNEPLGDINPFILSGYRGVRSIAGVLVNSSTGTKELFASMGSFLSNRENLFLTIARDRGIPIYTVLNGKKTIYTELRLH